MMNTAIEKKELERILDQAVQITFDEGFHTSLTLCADTGLLYRMACNSFHEESVSPEDVEEFSKEYFNVLCGRIAGAMYRVTQVPAHFGPPTFYHGRYEPEGKEIQFVLTYSDECHGGAQLIHHVPRSDNGGAV